MKKEFYAELTHLNRYTLYYVFIILFLFSLFFLTDWILPENIAGYQKIIMYLLFIPIFILLTTKKMYYKLKIIEDVHGFFDEDVFNITTDSNNKSINYYWNELKEYNIRYMVDRYKTEYYYRLRLFMRDNSKYVIRLWDKKTIDDSDSIYRVFLTFVKKYNNDKSDDKTIKSRIYSSIYYSKIFVPFIIFEIIVALCFLVYIITVGDDIFNKCLILISISTFTIIAPLSAKSNQKKDFDQLNKVYDEIEINQSI